jgi:hypothetical protein
MKKIMIVAAVWLVSAGVIFAQGGVEKYKKVKQDEVPALVQTSLQNDFDIASEDGTWSLEYSESSAGVGKPAILKPVAYTFRQKKDGNKVEIRFSPTGKLEHTKGIEPTEGHSAGR